MTECAAAWDDLSAWGTTTRASFWIALEQPGPWGRDALSESRLDPDVGRRLTEAAQAAGGRVLLIRQPGRHADLDTDCPRQVYVAGGLAGRPWLLAGLVEDPAQLLDLPFERLADGEPVEVPGFEPSEPVLLVCTNAKRDRCCALRGLPLALQLAERGFATWECSHTGGHRFAPTGIVLPLGQMLARLTPELGEAVLDAAASGELAVGTLSEAHDRGISHLPPAEAAAQSWVRATEGITQVGVLVSTASEGRVSVQHVDGRSWELDVEQRIGADLPDSCGKAPKPSVTWQVRPAAS